MGTSTLSLPSEVRVALGRARLSATNIGITIVVTSTFRTNREQQFLYNQFLRGLTAFPVARPGTSRHEFGLAVDLVAIPPSRLPEVVTIMRAVGFRWAGPADSVHFDYLLPVGNPKRVPTGLQELRTPFFPSLKEAIPKVVGAARRPSDCCCN